MIDGGIRRPWPSEVTAALERFKQGDLIASPPFFYFASGAHPLWGAGEALVGRDESGDDEGDLDEIVELDAADRPPYGIITTQTCDLREESPSPRKPWFQVSPVYQLTGTEQQISALLQRHDFARMTGSELSPGTWVADLRIEMPIEKGALVGQDPIQGFADEAGYIGFARQLGRRRDRAALASELVEALDRSRNELRRADRERHGLAVENLHSIRLLIAEGTHLEPVAAELHILIRGTASQEQRDWFDEWWDGARQDAEPHGIRLLPNQYHDSRQVDADLLGRLIDLGVPPRL